MLDASAKILLTGAAGFIGSFFASSLNQSGYENLILVDDFSPASKVENHQNLDFLYKIHREQLFDWLESNEGAIDYIIHLGARTDTSEFDEKLLNELNTNYTKKLWEYASDNQIPFIYASSAATYGDGSHGFSDQLNREELEKISPLNPYGWSKHVVDIWALDQRKKPPFWAGLKFFNVYGPHENHKNRMASVVYHAFHQIKETRKMKLFKSHNHKFKDGEQLRDFIYVKDLVKIIKFMMQNSTSLNSGIYNVGTGNARSFKDLSEAVFKTLNLKTEIIYIDTPQDIRDKYQYFTEAEMEKLKNAGYKEKFYSLEEGVNDYIKNYLLKEANN